MFTYQRLGSSYYYSVDRSELDFLKIQGIKSQNNVMIQKTSVVPQMELELFIFLLKEREEMTQLVVPI